MVAFVLAVAVLTAMLLALRPLASAWVDSSTLGGYGVAHGTDGLERGPQVPEDDDARWQWGDGKPRR